MSDTKQRGAASSEKNGPGLPGKHTDVKPMPLTATGKTFPDIAAHPNKAAIESLAARGIINGRDTGYEPNATMTRAEYTAVMTRGLGFSVRPSAVFTDVSADAWYSGFVGAAHYYGLVSGVSENSFNPDGTITRQEAAVMTARAARLCGMETAVGRQAVRDTLAQFSDYTQSDDWAQEALAFCYTTGILDESDLVIRPTDSVTRAEIAEMLYQLLNQADLL